MKAGKETPTALQLGPGLTRLGVDKRGNTVFVFSRLPGGEIVRGKMSFSDAKRAVEYVEARAGNWKVGFPVEPE